MNRFALLARIEAAPGKEKDVEELLVSALTIVEKEEGTRVWFALRFGPSSFGIFDAFPDEEARKYHLEGRVPVALTARAGELFVRPPVIEKVDLLAEKIDPARSEATRPRPAAA